jgi:inhibitor of KinA
MTLKFAPLGDRALLVYTVDEAAAQALASRLSQAAPAWQEDVVPAYASLGVFFDPRQIHTDAVMTHIRTRATSRDYEAHSTPGKRHTIPVCYERQLDLTRVANHLGLGEESVIAAHTGTLYTVHAVGFCPGFPYLGYLPDALRDVPRLDSPRLRLDAGSVGLTGKQTGVYPLVRPGGWNIIGQTPLVLVDIVEKYFPIHPGDSVRFERIDESEYLRLKGERLPAGT